MNDFYTQDQIDYLFLEPLEQLSEDELHTVLNMLLIEIVSSINDLVRDKRDLEAISLQRALVLYLHLLPKKKSSLSE